MKEFEGCPGSRMIDLQKSLEEFASNLKMTRQDLQ